MGKGRKLSTLGHGSVSINGKGASMTKSVDVSAPVMTKSVHVQAAAPVVTKSINVHPISFSKIISFGKGAAPAPVAAPAPRQAADSGKSFSLTMGKGL
jgi:hypothetical protein